jgi:small subunit ribosomal protein S20
MPHSRSAKKRVSQNERQRMRSKAVKSEMRTQVKKVTKAIEDGDADRAKAEMKLASKHLDKAAKTNVIHKNQAARRKSRLQKKINEL